MKRVALLLLAGLCVAFTFRKSKDKVLIFSLTKGYHHASIANGIVAIKAIGEKENFEVDTTTNPALFTYANLKLYKSLIFLSPTGNGLFNADQQQALVKYIHKGGGYVGIHAATDCLYDWEWYGKMVGGYFLKHPKIQQATIHVVDAKHLSTNMLPNPWVHTEEWYNYKQMNPDVKVLLKVDETTYTGGSMNNEHPIAWYHKFEGGRVFYTGLGHTKEDFTTDTLFQQHLTGGIKYALGRK